MSVDVDPEVADAQWLPSSPLRATAAPKFALSTTNRTEPAGGVMPEAGQTVAVKLTLWPVVEGLAEEVSTVVVPTATAGLVTTWPPGRKSVVEGKGVAVGGGGTDKA